MNTDRWRCFSAVACTIAALAFTTPASADTMVTRYRCEMLDGGNHIMNQDLSRTYPTAVPKCEAFSFRMGTPVDTRILYGDLGLSAMDRIRGAITVIEAPSFRNGVLRSGPPRQMPADLAALVNEACRRHQLDPAMVSALIYVESRYQPMARSPKGALGLMQVMPATAARYGIDSPDALYDPRINIDVGVRLLRDLQERYDGRLDLMLAAYNAGEGAVRKYGNRIPPYPETVSYVAQIIDMTQQRR